MSKHWSTTPAGSLVARCTIFIYQKVQKGEEEDGWKSYFDEHNSKFINSDTEEHNHELHDLFSRNWRRRRRSLQKKKLCLLTK